MKIKNIVIQLAIAIHDAVCRAIGVPQKRFVGNNAVEQELSANTVHEPVSSAQNSAHLSRFRQVRLMPGRRTAQYLTNSGRWMSARVIAVGMQTVALQRRGHSNGPVFRRFSTHI